MIVHERRRGVFAWRETQQARAAAALTGLVQVARQNFLLDTGRIARRRSPAFVQINAEEFEMRFGHGSPLQRGGDVAAEGIDMRGHRGTGGGGIAAANSLENSAM